MNNENLNSNINDENAVYYYNKTLTNQLSNEQSYIDNILKVNKGKKVSIYQTFVSNKECETKIFTGIIEQSGKDYIILSDPNTGKWYLLLMIYTNFIEFDEDTNIA